jgi:uncharacterized membrane protein
MSGRALAAVGVTALAVLWAGWLVVTPAVASAGQSRATLFAVAATYQLGARVCHQHADRSFHIGAVQMPVCARCAGLYGGAAAGAIVGLAWMRPRRRRANLLRVLQQHLRPVLLAAACPTVVLWALEHTVNVDMSNWVRCVGALPLGAVVAAFVVTWLAGAASDDNAAPSAIH